ncbi:MAG TPA: hypothetical protein VJ818_05920 [Actinomycetota bacterium]|nr:hypothetical protein [Actinomycetota bacterium]
MGRHKTSAATSLQPHVVSAGISVVVAVIYLAIVVRRQHDVSGRSIFVACFLVAVAALLVVSARIDDPLRRAALLAGAANSLIAIGFLGLFSIGVPLLIAGGIAMPGVARALTETPRPWGPTAAAAATLAALAIIIVGLLAT